MEFDVDALQELVVQEDQAVGACTYSCTRSCAQTWCPATCPVTTI
ncbi:ALQxL family class IV lanthipeptide [Streptomyces griseorubiginosus]